MSLDEYKELFRRQERLTAVLEPWLRYFTKLDTFKYFFGPKIDHATLSKKLLGEKWWSEREEDLILAKEHECPFKLIEGTEAKIKEEHEYISYEKLGAYYDISPNTLSRLMKHQIKWKIKYLRRIIYEEGIVKRYRYIDVPNTRVTNSKWSRNAKKEHEFMAPNPKEFIERDEDDFSFLYFEEKKHIDVEEIEDTDGDFYGI